VRFNIQYLCHLPTETALTDWFIQPRRSVLYELAVDNSSYYRCPMNSNRSVIRCNTSHCRATLIPRRTLLPVLPICMGWWRQPSLGKVLSSPLTAPEVMNFCDGAAEFLEPLSQGPTFLTCITKFLFRISTGTQVILTQVGWPSWVRSGTSGTVFQVRA
jgi:hypothetical protein